MVTSQEVAELSTLMKGFGVREGSIEIVLTALRVKSFELASTELRMTQGRVKHRFFEACKILESNGDARWAPLLLKVVS